MSYVGKSEEGDPKRSEKQRRAFHSLTVQGR